MRLYYGQAIKLMTKTLPCVLAIVGANAAFGALMGVYYITLYGILVLCTKMHLDLLGTIIFLVGIGGNFALYRLFKHYTLYLLRAGHVAVMAEYLEYGKLPEGVNQLQHGKNQVKERFGTVSSMFVVGELVNGVVRTITNLMGGVASFIPVEAVQQFVKVAQAVIRMACSYVDEAIMARAFIQKDKDVFEVAKEGTILYAQAWKPILTNAAGLALFSWASFAIFLVMALPVGFALSWLFPSSVILPSVVVILLAYLGKASLGDTFALATTLAAFHEETKAMEPSREWNERLTGASDKFRELSRRAGEKMGFGKSGMPSHGTAAPAPAAVAAAALPPLPQAVPAVVHSQLPPLPGQGV